MLGADRLFHAPANAESRERGSRFGERILVRGRARCPELQMRNERNDGARECSQVPSGLQIASECIESRGETCPAVLVADQGESEPEPLWTATEGHPSSRTTRRR